MQHGIMKMVGLEGVPADLNCARRYWVLIVVMLVYAMNIADRFVLSTLIEPMKAEFHLSDSGVGFLTGTSLALFYSVAGLPLGALADRFNRRNIIMCTLAVWSVFTALSGLAQSFCQLMFSRIGVGVGEAGATPASHSILSDYFPPTERIVAMTIFSFGIPLGMGIGAIGGGLLTATIGWRYALLIFACINVPILILLLTIQEPRRPLSAPDSPLVSRGPSIRESLRFIRKRRALRHVLVGATLATFAGQGLVWWTPAFLIRSHGFDVGGAGMQVGLMNGVGGTVALLGSSFIAMGLARSDIRWHCHFLAWVTLLITISGVVAYTAKDTGAAIIWLWLFIPFTSVHVGPTLALLQNLTGPDMRGITVAVFLFVANIGGLAIAPQLIGFASDGLAPYIADSAQSLRMVLAVSALTGIWSAMHFWAAIRTLTAELLV